jgi:hypothetical protein
VDPLGGGARRARSYLGGAEIRPARIHGDSNHGAGVRRCRRACRG